MGFFKDMQRARRAGNEIAAAQGRPTTALGRLGNLGNDVRAAGDQAEWAAGQHARAAMPDAPVAGGIPGVATLVAFRATGQLDGFQPVNELTLDIEADGWGREQVTTFQRMPYEALTLMTAGRRLRVLFDPNDARNLTVDWSATDV